MDVRILLNVALFTLLCHVGDCDPSPAKCLSREHLAQWARGLIPCTLTKYKHMLQWLNSTGLIPIPDEIIPVHQGRHLMSFETSLTEHYLPPNTVPRASQGMGWETVVGQRNKREATNHGEFGRIISKEMKTFTASSAQDKAEAEFVKQIGNIHIEEISSEFYFSHLEHMMQLNSLVYSLRASDTDNNKELSTLFYNNTQAYGFTDGLKSIVVKLDFFCLLLAAESDVVYKECLEIKSVVKCLSEYAQPAFEDGIEWAQCLYKCSDLPALSTCIIEHFDTLRPPNCVLPRPLKTLNTLAPIAIRGAVGLLKLDKCFYSVSSVPQTGPDNNKLILDEGARPVHLHLNMYLPPPVYCINLNWAKTVPGAAKWIADIIMRKVGRCNVQLEISTQSYIDKISAKMAGAKIKLDTKSHLCRDKSLKTSTVIGMHSHTNDTLGAGIISLNDTNWQQEIVVPIAAVIDSKAYGTIKEDHVIVRLKAGLLITITRRLSMQINDLDTETLGGSTCNIIGDAHIITFDQHMYNNYYEGHFIVYQHNSLPYEVQGTFQRCKGSSETCVCAVSVRAGNDVFVVDRCVRSDPDGTTDIVRVILYQNGDVSPNMMMYRQDEGTRFKVLLPQGTLITILVNELTLDAFIRPSAADFNATRGLCGFYDHDKNNDLQLPDGNIYADADGKVGGQARGFNKAWRYIGNETLYQGARANVDVTGLDDNKYCTCTDVLYKGTSCQCGHGYMVATCDLRTSGQWLPHVNLSQISMPSLTEYIHRSGEVDVGESLNFNISYEPPENSWTGNEMTEKEARSHCDKVLKADPMVAACIKEFKKRIFGSSTFVYPLQLEACVEGIKASGNTTHAASYVAAARQKCRDMLYQSDKPIFTQDKDPIEKGCPGNCAAGASPPRGQCVLGRCQCIEPWAGPACAHRREAPVTVHTPPTVLCDTQYEDCRWLAIYGNNFLSVNDLYLKAYELEMTIGNAPHNILRSEVVPVSIITPTQAAAQLPREANYKIEVFTGAEKSFPVMNYGNVRYEFTLLIYDSVCYECDMKTTICDRRQTYDYCVISGRCYVEAAASPDPCYHCDPRQLTNDWSIVPGSACHEHHVAMMEQESEAHRTHSVKVWSAITLSVAVTLFTLIIFFLVGNNLRKANAEKVRYATPITSTAVPIPSTPNAVSTPAVITPARITPADPSNAVQESSLPRYETPASATFNGPSGFVNHSYRASRANTMDCEEAL